MPWSQLIRRFKASDIRCGQVEPEALEYLRVPLGVNRVGKLEIPNLVRAPVFLNCLNTWNGCARILCELICYTRRLLALRVILYVKVYSRRKALRCGRLGPWRDFGLYLLDDRLFPIDFYCVGAGLNFARDFF